MNEIEEEKQSVLFVLSGEGLSKHPPALFLSPKAVMATGNITFVATTNINTNIKNASTFCKCFFFNKFSGLGGAGVGWSKFGE